MADDYPEGTSNEVERERRRREANRPLEEAGEGESEGFELAEQALVDHSSHADDHGTTRILRDGRSSWDTVGPPDDDRYGEADAERHPDR